MLPPVRVLSPSQLADIVFGSIFLFVALAAWSFAAVRRSEVRLVFWLGAWSGVYGFRLFLESPAVVPLLPHWLQQEVRLLWVSIIYLLLPVAFLAWQELSIGGVRTFLRVVTVLSILVGVAGIAVFARTGVVGRLLLLNNAISAASLLLLVVVVTTPRLARRYLVLPNRAVVVVGTLLFAIEALYYSFARALHYPTASITGSLGLSALLFSFGYVAVQRVLTSESRLQAIESELAIAREIQASILPAASPRLKGLHVASAYRPMTSVAGDFYEFIPVDEHRLGVLVADVTGHGVPAALIAAMIKVAMQSVSDCAQDPGEVLLGLNRVLLPQIGAQLISAAYLFVDMENGVARYSAAGHPPLLRVGPGRLERIESNGLPIGVLPDPVYPVLEMNVAPGDRFVLYTDGVSEPENADGEAFGDARLGQVAVRNATRDQSGFIADLLEELRRWRRAAEQQHDDITLVVVDLMPR